VVSELTFAWPIPKPISPPPPLVLVTASAGVPIASAAKIAKDRIRFIMKLPPFQWFFGLGS